MGCKDADAIHNNLYCKAVSVIVKTCVNDNTNACRSSCDSMVSTNNTAQSSTHEYPVSCCEIPNIIGDSVGAMDYNQA